ncbi:hypothetical protein AB0L75_15980 [Streptomyces sp. NPDC052101]|uniref:hypothetical protein n=1 Tax=Streptomyces sp. NPDC052101 TaxID=3155763 RepID=UPI00342A08AE
MPTNTSRAFHRSRTLAVFAAATAGGLLFAGPARSAPAVDTGTVHYSGQVSCASKFPNAVPTKVTLKVPAVGKSVSDDNLDNNGQVTAPYGPVDLTVPVDTRFSLRSTVTCTVPGGKSHQFNTKITEPDLSDDDDVTLNIS